MKNVAIAVVLILMAVAVQGQTSISLTTSTKYFTDNGDLLHDGQVVQADISHKVGRCFADLWVSQSASGINNAEIDYTAGCDVNKYLSFELAYFDLQPLWKPSDVIQSTLKFAVPKKIGHHELSFFTVVNHIHSRDQPTKNSGEFFRVGVSDAWAMSSHTTLNASIFALQDTGIFGGMRGYVAQATVSVAVKHGLYTLEPFVRISRPFVSDRRTLVAFALRVSR